MVHIERSWQLIDSHSTDHWLRLIPNFSVLIQFLIKICLVVVFQSFGWFSLLTIRIFAILADLKPNEVCMRNVFFVQCLKPLLRLRVFFTSWVHDRLSWSFPQRVFCMLQQWVHGKFLCKVKCWDGGIHKLIHYILHKKYLISVSYHRRVIDCFHTLNHQFWLHNKFSLREIHSQRFSQQLFLLFLVNKTL